MNGAKMRPRRLQRGQAVVELALVLPILLVLVSLAIDASRAESLTLQISGIARAGAIVAAHGPNSANEVVTAVRTATSDFPAPSWGSLSCSAAACGDPQGCVAGDNFWASSGPATKACFAVGTCSFDPENPGTCSSAISWGSWPSSWIDSTDGNLSVNGALVFRVSARFDAVVPFDSQFFAQLVTLNSEVWVSPEY